MSQTTVVVTVSIFVIAMLAVIAMTLFVISQKPTEPTPEQLLVAHVHGKYPETANGNDNEIIYVAQTTCQHLDAGDSVESIIMLVSSKYLYGPEPDFDMIGYTMVEGVNQLCPRNIDKMREYANVR